MRTIAIAFIIILGWFRSAHAEDIHLRIAPNPASSNVELTLPAVEKGMVKVEIYTILGTQIQSTVYQVSEGAVSLNLSVANLPDGMYLVRVSQNDNISVKRLKVQHN